MPGNNSGGQGSALVNNSGGQVGALLNNKGEPVEMPSQGIDIGSSAAEFSSSETQNLILSNLLKIQSNLSNIASNTEQRAKEVERLNADSKLIAKVKNIDAKVDAIHDYIMTKPTSSE